MVEQIQQTASNLLPLLLVLLVIFGGLIAVAIGARIWTKRKVSARKAKGAASPFRVLADDVITVLGRTFQVTGNFKTSQGENPANWCSLDGEDGASRLLLFSADNQAWYFPGQCEPPEGTGLPEKIDRDEGKYSLISPPWQLTETWSLAVYTGPGERRLALETLEQKVTLWRGKAVPFEGIRVLEEN